MIDLHRDIYQKDYDRIVNRFMQRPDISEENKHIIRDVYNWLLINNLSKVRAVRYLWDLTEKARRTEKSFKQFTEADIREWIAEINACNRSDETKQSRRISVKRLFQFLADCPFKEYPKKVAWIKVAGKSKRYLNAEELPTEKDVLAMLAVAKSPRDRAIISILFEAGLRVGELLLMQIKHIVFNEAGCHLIVPKQGKTGSRRVILRDSVPALTMYLNYHPQRDNPEAPLWLLTYKKTENLTYPAVRKMLKSVAKDAGIRKRVHPHLFRHAAVSRIASQVSEPVMKTYFGWDMSSRMVAVYTHMFNKDVDSAILKARGVLVKDTDLNTMPPLKCPNCKADNPHVAKYCMICHMPLENKLLAEQATINTAVSTLVSFLGLTSEQTEKLFVRAQKLSDAELNAELKKHGKKLKGF